MRQILAISIALFGGYIYIHSEADSAKIWFAIYAIGGGLTLFNWSPEGYILNARKVLGLLILLISAIYLPFNHSGDLYSLLAFGGVWLGGYLAEVLSEDSGGAHGFD